MRFKDQNQWLEGLQKNADPYGAAVFTFAENWANLMEEQLEKGCKLENVAKETSSQAAKDTGITGFQYGCAVSILAGTWEHGESLRQWHNLDTQIGTEGEKANKKGTVLNPALLTIGKKERG